MWRETAVLSHTIFLTKNVIQSKYQDQFSCYPYKLSKEIHVPGGYPFPALKSNQPGSNTISDFKVIAIFITDVFCHITNTYSEPYS